VITHAYNPSTWEVETGGLRIRSELGLCRQTLYQKVKNQITAETTPKNPMNHNSQIIPKQQTTEKLRQKAFQLLFWLK
jgi:hypothetical protein